jgi:hypothetical protein
MISIENIVNQYLEKRNEEEKKAHAEYSGLISASLLGQCHRRQFYSIQKIEQSNPPDERALRVFACGNVFHQFIQDIAKENKNYFIESAYKDNTFSVRADAVTEDSVYEFKSMHSKGFWYMDSEIKAGKTIQEFKIEHCLQVGLGAMCFKKENACLVYISKDDLCIRQFNLRTQDLEPLVNKEVDAIKDVLKKAVLPPPEPRLYGKDKKGNYKECQYCAFKDRCMTERG